MFLHNSGLDEGVAEERSLKVQLWLQTTRAYANEASVAGTRQSVFTVRCTDLLSNGSPGLRAVVIPSDE